MAKGQRGSLGGRALRSHGRKGAPLSRSMLWVTATAKMKEIMTWNTGRPKRPNASPSLAPSFLFFKNSLLFSFSSYSFHYLKKKKTYLYFIVSWSFCFFHQELTWCHGNNINFRARQTWFQIPILCTSSTTWKSFNPAKSWFLHFWKVTSSCFERKGHCTGVF